MNQTTHDKAVPAAKTDSIVLAAVACVLRLSDACRAVFPDMDDPEKRTEIPFGALRRVFFATPSAAGGVHNAVPLFPCLSSLRTDGPEAGAGMVGTCDETDLQEPQDFLSRVRPGLGG